MEGSLEHREDECRNDDSGKTTPSCARLGDRAGDYCLFWERGG